MVESPSEIHFPNDLLSTLLVRLVFQKGCWELILPRNITKLLFWFRLWCLLPCHPHPLNRATPTSWCAGLSVRCFVACGWRGKHLCGFALALLVLPWHCRGDGTNKGRWRDVNKVKALKEVSCAASSLKWKLEKRACWRRQMDAPKSTMRRVLFRSYVAPVTTCPQYFDILGQPGPWVCGLDFFETFPLEWDTASWVYQGYANIRTEAAAGFGESQRQSGFVSTWRSWWWLQPQTSATFWSGGGREFLRGLLVSWLGWWM